MDRFWLYWSSASISYLGDGIRFAALPLLAATLSPRPADVATIAVAAGLPWLVFGLFAGLFVDRLPRLLLMSTMQVARTALMLGIAGTVATGHMSITLLAVLVFLLGTLEVFYDVASHAVLPQIVERNRIQSANSRLMTAEVATFELIGPVLGAALFSVAVAIPFTVDAATFAVSTLVLLLLIRRIPRANRQAPQVASGASIVKDFVDGFRWFASHRLVRSLTLLGAGINLGLEAVFTLLVLLAREELGLEPVGYGLLIAVGAVGAFGAGLIADRLSSGGMRAYVCMATGPVIALCVLVVARSGDVLVTGAAIFVFSGMVMLFNVVSMSLRQLITPDELLGRVLSVHRFLCWGAIPIGAVLAGVVGEIYGVRGAVLTGGIIILITSTLILPDLWRARSQYSDTALSS